MFSLCGAFLFAVVHSSMKRAGARSTQPFRMLASWRGVNTPRRHWTEAQARWFRERQQSQMGPVMARSKDIHSLTEKALCNLVLPRRPEYY